MELVAVMAGLIAMVFAWLVPTELSSIQCQLPATLALKIVTIVLVFRRVLSAVKILR
jgi:hypothetical protein